ncbi:hypothetical protein [Flavilitoribacter nigricans]|uniref:Uncharacterized protein n=1 Tax=Flavilitoribacter nigricans (strain ATCC 23147 / DSM 23189 / NBRC 102662 / NCIMB 1420 / SS-2) TaxID=1122177 RepID=A0A2D0NCR3_FLAN2|nr:hypothetical protein [Flavilitoribacter nigricans]PHN05969.1 hypothetical protein CRP01_13425 [Flavilitoribacter nigricans DSM 23189 = NBRC 102662]
MANSINWDSGQLINLNVGDTATCKGGLNVGQVYGLFFYNAAGNDASTTVNVVWSNSNPPVMVNVPGTTMNQGLAAICFVDGSQTNTVSASVTHGNQGANVQAFICSVKMPVNTSGIQNTQLPLDGNQHPFHKFTRFYAVPASHWYSAQIQSDVNQFISVQFTESKANVYIVNKIVDPSNVIKYAGDAQDLVTVKTSDHQSISFNLQGNGRQFVWMNADSIQNSQDATIAVQSLSNLFATL